MPHALIVADPVEGLKPAFDTSLCLAEEALTRGWQVSFTTPSLLWRGMDGVMADAVPISNLSREQSPTLGERVTRPAADFAVIAMRKDPPVDPHFMTCLQLLDDAARHSLVTAHPRGLLAFSEKLMAPELLSYGPPTLVSQDPARLMAFLREHRDVVLKPLYRGGGSGIVRLSADNLSARSIISIFQKDLKEPVQMQAFLPEVFEGDSRVIMVGGDVIGAFARLPEKGADFRSNMAQGGGVVPRELTPDEQDICARVAEVMQREGVLLAGLDFIGGRLTEVNVTSPTGCRVLETMYGRSGAAEYWNALEGQLA